MGAEVIDRRAALFGGAAAALLAVPAWARRREIGVASTDTPLAVGTRTTRLTRVEADGVRRRGVALFSTGYGSWPDRYRLLLHDLALDGWTVLAPLHVDSTQHPDRARFTTRQSFIERLADLNAVAAVAARTLGGQPLVGVGHSFGTLSLLCLGGALKTIGRFRNPAVRAVLGFSTPGNVPGLVDAAGYQSLDVPVMIVTGSDDRLPAGLPYPSEPGDHLLPVQVTPSGGYGLVMAGGTHELVADATLLARAIVPSRLFLDAYGRGDARARTALDGYRPTNDDGWSLRMRTR